MWKDWFGILLWISRRKEPFFNPHELHMNERSLRAMGYPGWELGEQEISPVWSVKCGGKKLIPRFGKSGAVVDPMVPPKRYAHVLTPGTCECDIIWEKGLCRWNVKMRSSWIIQWALNPISSALTGDMEKRHGDRNSMWRRRRVFGLCSQHATPGTTRRWQREDSPPALQGEHSSAKT